MMGLAAAVIFMIIMGGAVLLENTPLAIFGAIFFITVGGVPT